MEQQDAGRRTEQAELHSDPPHGRLSKDDPGTGETVLQFGNCRLWPRTRRLLVDGSPIEIGSRAFDLLTVLIEARGILLSKSEIIVCQIAIALFQLPFDFVPSAFELQFVHNR